MRMKATFAAGCFWQVEAEFRKVDGVTRTTVGYEGGNLEQPTYEDVCTDRTGHAEVLEVEYDPERISYERLLSIFFSMHDPTQVNRQGPDVGTQYRSAVFVHSREQEESARAFKEKLQPKYRKPIATEIVTAQTFWPAEEYHQRYLEKRGMSSCTLELAEPEPASS